MSNLGVRRFYDVGPARPRLGPNGASGKASMPNPEMLGPNPPPNSGFIADIGNFQGSLITSKVLDARRRGATTEAY